MVWHSAEKVNKVALAVHKTFTKPGERLTIITAYYKKCLKVIYKLLLDPQELIISLNLVESGFHQLG